MYPTKQKEDEQTTDLLERVIGVVEQIVTTQKETYPMIDRIIAINSKFAKHLNRLYVIAFLLSGFILGQLLSPLVNRTFGSIWNHIWISSSQEMRVAIVGGGFILLSVVLAYPATQFWRWVFRQRGKE